ncbi:MAG: GldG family protein [Calditrichaeota bacterium]|nr:GldG family protein [Calditrichota bacterium]
MNNKNSSFFSPIAVLLIVANLLVLNIWTSRMFGRIDLTENKVYTLSDVTKEIIRELEEPLTIKAYFTKDLPAPYNNISRYVEDQLAEMKAYGKGKFRFEFLDPEDEEDLKKEAESFRLEPMQVNEVRKDKVQYKLAYMGMALIYEDRQEVIPMVQSLANIEYEILTKIKRVTSDEEITIGFLEGHEEASLRESMTSLDRELRKMYELKPVSLAGRSDVPDDIDLLCIIGPLTDIPETEKFMIDQFLMRGGKLLMAYNNVKTDIAQMQAQRSPLRLDPWTENYGFKITDQLVMDRSAPTMPFQTMGRYGRQIAMVVYPLFPEIMTFNRDVMATSALRQVRMYFPSPIDTTIAGELDSVAITPLVYTSPKSAVMLAPYDINPLTQRSMNDWNQGPYALGVVLQGKFDSYFVDKEIPVTEEGEPVSDVEIITSSPDTRIIVLSDAFFIQDQYLVPGLDNLTMALNMIDWMVQDERLISIRSREVSSRPIGEVSDTVRRTVKYTSLILPPFLVALFGLMRWRLRSARRKALSMQTGSTRIGGEN